MKIQIKFLLTFLIAFVVINLIGQNVDTTGISDPVFPGGGTSLDEMLSIYNAIYGALVIIWGYVAKFFGFNTKPNRLIFMIIGGGVVLAGAFIALGWSDVLPIAFSFLAAIGLYNAILQPMGLKVTNRAEV